MALFEPLQLGDVQIRNRILLAPLTRCRATVHTHIPSDMMAVMYSQRASGGLLIAEATMVSPNSSAFYTEPGIYSDEQVAAWKKVTDAVHAKGGLIFLQLWHGGRVVIPINNEDGKAPMGPSAIRVTHGPAPQHNASGEKIDHVAPTEMTQEEIKAVIGDFARGAKNAITAGFDGVEVHGANGYLIDQFWRSSSNQRTDNYGGSQENRARFMLEVVDAVSAVVGAGRVGIRLSPINSYNDMKDDAPMELLAYTCEELSKRKIAYVHAMRADFFQAQQADVLGTARKHFKGALIANMGYTPAEAEAAVASKAIDAVAFGTTFLANPDLPERIRAGASLNQPNPATFYSRDEAGYTDYPVMA